MTDIHWPNILNAAMNGETIGGKKPGAPANETLSVPQILRWSESGLDAQWDLDPLLLNSRGELFGGYYSVLADVALSYTAMTGLKDDERFKTLDLRVSYYRPFSSGTLSIACEISNRSRSILHAEALFTNEQAKKVAKAVASFAVVASS